MNKFKIFFLLALFIFVNSLSATTSDEWQSHRLPFGPEETRMKMTQVFMNGITRAADGMQLDVEAFYDELARADVVLIGESHTNDTHHAMQEKIIRGLAGRGQSVVLALEMFNASQNGALDELVSNRTDLDRFPAASGYFSTWGHNYRYYRPLFAAAQEIALPVRGVNLPSGRVRALRMAGPDKFMDQLLPGEPVPDMNSAEHRFFIETMMQGLGAKSPQMFPAFYLAQCLWDAAMAEGIIAAAREFPGKVVVGIAGHGHVSYGLGIARIIRNRSSLKVVTIMPVDVAPLKKAKKGDHPGFAAHMGKAAAGPEKASLVVSAGLADYLIGVEKEKQERYPASPFLVTSRDGKLVAGNVMPGTWAYKLGFRTGDQIISFAGRTWKDADDLNFHLHHLGWGNRLKASIQRNGRRIAISGKLLPEKSNSEK